MYQIEPKAIIGKSPVKGPVITINLQPDPNKAVSINTFFPVNDEIIAGTVLPGKLSNEY